MRRKHLPLLFLTVLCSLTACTHYYYAPNTLQTPFLQERHDTQVNLGLISGDEFNGWEIQSVYSPVKYGAVMFNHFNVKHGHSTEVPDEDWGEGHLTEFALGAYYPANRVISLSFFGGWGAGRVLNIYDLDARSDLRFQRWFLQPGFSAQGKWARFGMSCRLNRLQYIKGDIRFDIGEHHLNIIENIERESPFFIPEIGFSIGLGASPVWFNASFNFNTKSNKSDYGFASSTAAFAIRFELDYFWRKAVGGVR